MIIANCDDLNQLVNVEYLLFSMEWEYDPYILPFSIKCNDEIFNYKIKKICEKYRIITY